MRVVDFPPEADAILRVCDEVNVVVSFVMLEPESPDETGETAHRRAAAAAVMETCARWEHTLEEELLQLTEKPHVFDAEYERSRAEQMKAASWRDRRHVKRAFADSAAVVRDQTLVSLRKVLPHVREQTDAARHMDPEALRGRQIPTSAFFGPNYHDGRPLVDLSAGFELDDDLDFVRAFCWPPHGLGSIGQLGDSGAELLFADVVRVVLQNPDDTSVIWAWDTEWSSYFDAGREWWGTGLWTLDVDHGVVAVLASATD